jgi:hypothetical protein
MAVWPFFILFGYAKESICPLNLLWRVFDRNAHLMQSALLIFRKTLKGKLLIDLDQIHLNFTGLMEFDLV